MNIRHKTGVCHNILNKKKLRKLCLRAMTKDLKHLKTYDFHKGIMRPFFFKMTLYSGL